MATLRVAGADGCRAGWLVVSATLVEGGEGLSDVSVQVVDALVIPLAEPGLAVLGVDTPIGLDPVPAEGGRAADRAARRALALGAPPGLRGTGARVFSAPSAAQLEAFRGGADYAGVNAVHLRGPRLTLQAFHILSKIAEADRLAASDRRVVEVHPELSFLHLGGATLPPKRLASARAQRRALLDGAGFDVAGMGTALGPARGRWQADDLMDACAICWSAARIARGQARRYPEVGEPAILA